MKFVKEILSEGPYLVSTPSGPKEKQITAEDIRNYAETGAAMLKAGIKIPAPWMHVIDGKMPLPLSAEGVTELDPTKNAGFWDSLYFELNDEGTLSLFGIVDAPGTTEQPESPAWKVSRTVKDTSIATFPNFVDGKGKNWGPYAIAHIALPVDPVEPGQSNFIPLPGNFEGMVMSRKIMTPNVSQLLTLLADRGIALPTDTTSDNFMDRLMVALMNNGGSKSGLTTKPSNGKVESYPIMMSLTKPQVDAILSSNVKNPTTGQPFTAEDFQDVPSAKEKELSESIVMMSQHVDSIYKAQYRARIDTLIATGCCDQAYADKYLNPLAESIQMSFTKGQINSTPLDTLLAALEALPPKVPGKQVPPTTPLSMSRTPSGASTVDNPLLKNGPSVTDERANEIINQMLGIRTN